MKIISHICQRKFIQILHSYSNRFVYGVHKPSSPALSSSVTLSRNLVSFSVHRSSLLSLTAALPDQVLRAGVSVGASVYTTSGDNLAPMFVAELEHVEVPGPDGCISHTLR